MTARDPSLFRGLLITILITVALYAVLFAGFVTVYDLPPLPWGAR